MDVDNAKKGVLQSSSKLENCANSEPCMMTGNDVGRLQCLDQAVLEGIRRGVTDNYILTAKRDPDGQTYKVTVLATRDRVTSDQHEFMKPNQLSYCSLMDTVQSRSLSTPHVISFPTNGVGPHSSRLRKETLRNVSCNCPQVESSSHDADISHSHHSSRVFGPCRH